MIVFALVAVVGVCVATVPHSWRYESMHTMVSGDVASSHWARVKRSRWIPGEEFLESVFVHVVIGTLEDNEEFVYEELNQPREARVFRYSISVGYSYEFAYHENRATPWLGNEDVLATVEAALPCLRAASEKAEWLCQECKDGPSKTCEGSFYRVLDLRPSDTEADGKVYLEVPCSGFMVIR